MKRNDIANALGVSLRTVSDLLGERRPWRVDEIEMVAAWLDISVSDLLFPKHAGYNNRRPHIPKRPSSASAPFDFEASAFNFDSGRRPSAADD